MSSTNPAPSADTPISIKLALNNGESKRFKLPLRDLGANTLPDKLRSLLAIQPSQSVIFERYSDSAGAYITLDSTNFSVYKQLYRAAKAKLKLRIKATVTDSSTPKTESTQSSPVPPNHLPAHCYVPLMNPGPLKVAPVTVDQERTSGLVAPAASPANGVKSPHLDISRPSTVDVSCQKLPYDPCMSPGVSATQSLLDTANPTMNEMKPPVLSSNPLGLAPIQDYQMQLMLLEQQNKRRLLQAREQFDHLPENKAEAPVPRSFPAKDPLIAEHTARSVEGVMQPSLSPSPSLPTAPAPFTICCNNCDASIPDAHWHCSICDDGDFDLCPNCVDKGFVCDSDRHWLIKRTVKDNKVVNSITETIAPKTSVKAEEANTESSEDFVAPEGNPSRSRTCNSCVGVFPESKFVTCLVCEDYDLCIPCHVGLKHGHQPSHAFAPACEDTKLDLMATKLLAAGRNMRHFAICDGCDKDIYGTRHKCLKCPDWDFCSNCIKDARTTHPGHRFIALNEPIPFPTQRNIIHYGINCDGPLCKKVTHNIVGDRYKCAVCHDTDFCAKCEALPTAHHNRTHPLIKFKSPVRNVSVTTLGEKENGEHMCTMGDRSPQFSSKATETTPTAASVNAATQVQTVAEVKPTEPAKEESRAKVGKLALCHELQAHYIRDAIADGSVLQPNVQFKQVWTLRNPGPHAWPAGCSVRFIGGDTMFNVHPSKPSSVSDIVKATESNTIDRVIPVGEEVDFTVVMRTPEREGKAISYWRLKAADGWPFGHKLWCDITVKSPKTEVVADEPSNKHVEKDGTKVKSEDVVHEAESGKEETGSETEAHQSQMIFPKLDKESPVSSTHEAVTASASSNAASAVTASEEKTLLEDVESLSLEDDDASSTDGFLTDEEYELLEASEDDFAEAVNGKAKK